MVNELLYMLANRGSGFSYPGFVPNRVVVPTPTTDAQERLSARLGVNTHDYYLRGVLYAVEAFQDLRKNFSTETTYDLSVPFVDDFGNLRPGAPGLVGTLWQDPPPSVYPCNFEFVVTRVSAGQIRISGKVSGSVVNLNVIEDASDSHRFQVIITDKDIRSIRIDGGLPVGHSIPVTYYPKAFPYAGMAALLRKDYALYADAIAPFRLDRRLLITTNPVEVVATAATALALSRMRNYV